MRDVDETVDIGVETGSSVGEPPTGGALEGEAAQRYETGQSLNITIGVEVDFPVSY